MTGSMFNRIKEHCRREGFIVRGEFETSFVVSNNTHWARIGSNGDTVNLRMKLGGKMLFKTELSESTARFYITKFAATRAADVISGLFL